VVVEATGLVALDPSENCYAEPQELRRELVSRAAPEPSLLKQHRVEVFPVVGDHGDEVEFNPVG
jgi:hypothetical protein